MADFHKSFISGKDGKFFETATCLLAVHAENRAETRQRQLHQKISSSGTPSGSATSPKWLIAHLGEQKEDFYGKLNPINYQRSSGTHQERWRDRPDETSATAR
jgi:hypothetical protein